MHAAPSPFASEFLVSEQKKIENFAFSAKVHFSQNLAPNFQQAVLSDYRNNPFEIMLQVVTALFLLLSTTIVVGASSSEYDEKISLHTIQEAQEQFINKEHSSTSPFLSATLKTELYPVSTFIDSTQRSLLSDALTSFLKHVFEGQQTYGIEIVGVSIVEEQLVKNVRRLSSNTSYTSMTRTLALNALQNDLLTTSYYDDDAYDDDEEATVDDETMNEDATTEYVTYNTLDNVENTLDQTVDVDVTFDDGILPDEIQVENFFEEEQEIDETTEVSQMKAESDGYTLAFAIVVSAEHTQQQSLTHADFQAMLIHICRKFQEHLVEYVTEIDDDYFASVASVIVNGYEAPDSGVNKSSSGSKLSTALIVTIAVCGIGFVLFVLAIVKSYGRRKAHVMTNEWRAREITMNNANNSVVKSLKVLYNKPVDDNYSFDPISSDNEYNGFAIPRYYSDHVHSLPKEDLTFREESEGFDVSSLDKLSTIYIPPSDKEYQHVFAPPGKIGVAIDVVNGNPTVHKIRRGSPLEGLLKPNDLVIAIDDVDTTQMSAADVTQLMVKRMNYRRKITFVRRDC